MFTIKSINENTIQLISDTNLSGTVSVYCADKPTKDKTYLQKIGDFDVNEILLPKVAMPVYYLLENEQIDELVSYRKLPLEGTFNFRDLGGYLAHQGKYVKWGKFFRADALGNLTKDDVEILQKIGIKTIVDYREDGEWQKAPDILWDGVQLINLSPNAAVARVASGNVMDDKTKIEKLISIANSPEGKTYFEKNQNEMKESMKYMISGAFSVEQYQKFMQLILQNQNLPVVFHCRGGKDRTGVGAILILIALGASKEVILADYLLTKQCSSKRNEKRMDEYRKFTDNQFVLDYLASLMDTKEDYFDGLWNEIIEHDANPEHYLIDILGITQQEIDKFREENLY